MKRAILLLLFPLLLLSGCKYTNDTFKVPEDPVIIVPDDIATETADGYRDITVKENIVYYANKESKKIHLPSCRYAKIMAESKVLLEKDYELLLLNGYTPCAICNP